MSASSFQRCVNNEVRRLNELNATVRGHELQKLQRAVSSAGVTFADMMRSAVRELREYGWSQQDVADEFGVSRARAQQWCD